MAGDKAQNRSTDGHYMYSVESAESMLSPFDYGI